MEFISALINIILHLDQYLAVLIENYGVLTYFVLFLIIFCETGLVVAPILPGDSLLFAAGAFAAKGSLEVELLLFLLIIAAVAGDTVNYKIGNFIGPKIFAQEKVRFLKKEYLEKTKKFYDKHGKKTIVLARFVPIVRTFAPFVAGIGKMNYLHFLTYNILGGIAWILIFILGGYFFGNVPIVKENFTLVILAIIIISILPGIIGILQEKYKKPQVETKAL